MEYQVKVEYTWSEMDKFHGFGFQIELWSVFICIVGS